MVKIKDIVRYLENIAPRDYQESYDNTGLLTGSLESNINGILISLDATEAVLDEAIERSCNLVIVHHPIIFKGIRKITGSNYVERTLITAIKNDIAIYAIHTNLDNIIKGVNSKLAEKLGIIGTRILSPGKSNLSKLVTFVPKKNTGIVLKALHEAGAGEIGNYDNCSFVISGSGNFRPNESASPLIGKKNIQETVEEERIEVILPNHLENQVLDALMRSHPYEEAAYFLQKIENINREIGSGLIGELENKMGVVKFLNFVKEKLSLTYLKYTPVNKDSILSVAICGGSGSFLLKTAIKAGADAFITADVKYHDFFDSEGKILFADVGHYESEVYTKELIYELINKKFSNIALQLSGVNTNPIHYI